MRHPAATASLCRWTAVASTFLLLTAALPLVPSAAADPLETANVALSSLEAGSQVVATVSFTTGSAGSGLPGDGKIRVTFGPGFDLSGITSVSAACSSMEGTVATALDGQTVILTRDGSVLGDDAGQEESCTISEVQNPPVSGPTGDFTLETRSGDETVLDTATAAGLTILPGPIQNGAATSSNSRVGETATYTLLFRNTNIIPPAGAITITFPPDLTLSQPPIDPLGLEEPFGECNIGAATLTISGQTATYRRTGGLDLASGPRSCTLKGITNPTSAGVTGPFQISTLTAEPDSLTIDAGTAPGVPIVNGVIVSTSTETADSGAGAVTTAFFNFTIASRLPADGKFTVTFPPDVSLDAVDAGSSTCTFTGTVTVTRVLQTVSLARSGSLVNPASEALPAPYGCAVAGIRNPPVSGTTTAFALTTRRADGTLIDSGSSPPIVIGAGRLSSVTTSSTTLLAAGMADYTFVFTTTNGLPDTADVAFGFPLGYEVDGATGSCSGFPGDVETSVSGRMVTLSRSGTATTGPTAVTCTIEDVRNPFESGLAANVSIETSDQDVPIDAGLAPAVTLVPDDLVGVTATPAAFTAGALTTYSFVFVTPGGLAADAKVRIQFPADFSSGTVSAACSSMDGRISLVAVGLVVTLRRQHDGASNPATVQPPESETCTISGFRNPRQSGPSGSFAVDVLTPTESVTYTGTAASVSILPGVLGAVTATPSNSAPGASNVDFTFGFTTINGIPADGKISFTFPPGFGLATSIGSCTSIGGTLVPTVTGQVVTFVRVATAAEAADRETCVIQRVTNTIEGGPTGVFTVGTFSNQNVAIDQGTAPPVILAAGELLDTVATAVDSAAAGAATRYRLEFRTATTWPADGTFLAEFPEGFTLGEVDVESRSGCTTGSFDATLSSRTLTVQRSGGSPCAPGPLAFTLTLTNIRNPPVSGETDPFQMATRTAQNQHLDADVQEQPTVAITPNALTVADLQPRNLAVNTIGTSTATFTLANPLPADGRIEIEFPDGFDLSSITETSGTCPGFDGSVQTSVDDLVVTITRFGTTPLAGASAVTCHLGDVKNPATTGTTESYFVRTLQADARVIDDSGPLPGDAIALPATLAESSVILQSLSAGGITTAEIGFTSTQWLPRDGKLRFEFPRGSDLAQVTTATCPAIDGGLDAAILATAIVLTRDGSGVDIGPGEHVCTVEGMRNPRVSGPTDPYTVALLDVAGTTIAQATVAGNVLVPAPLTAADVEPLYVGFGATGIVEIRFTSTNPIPSDGIISVTFPAGFDVQDAEGGFCTGVDDAFLTSVTTQTISLVRDGTADPLDPGEYVCSVDAVRNPLALGSTGTYAVRTKAANQFTIDEALAVGPDTIIQRELPGIMGIAGTVQTGRSTLYTFLFDTVVAWPADGQVAIRFPDSMVTSGVDFASIDACGTDIGTFIISVELQTVFLNRLADGEECPPGPFVVDVGPIGNPRVSGLSDEFQVTLTGQTGTVPGVGIEPSLLQDALVVLDDDRAGSFTTLTVSFGTQNPVPADGHILITVPSGFGLGATSTVTCPTLDGAVSLQRDGQRVDIIRSGDANPTLVGMETCILSLVANPPASGPSGTFQVTTADAQRTPIDEDLGVDGPTVAPGEGTLISLTASPATAGATASITLEFLLANPWPVDAFVDIEFPPGFGLETVELDALQGCSGEEGTFLMTVEDDTITLERTGDGDPCSATTPIEVTLDGITNPRQSGHVGPFVVRTRSSTPIDEASYASLGFFPGLMTNLQVVPGSSLAGAETSLEISFRPTNPIPGGGRIRVDFPDGYEFLDEVGAACPTIAGDIDVVAENGILTIFRNDITAETPAIETCVLTSLRNPTTSGLTPGFGITTLTAAGVIIDAGVAPGTTILANTLRDVTLLPTIPNPLAGAVSAFQLRFTTTNVWPSDGRLLIAFPTNFGLSPTSAVTVVDGCEDVFGAWSTARSGTTLVLERTGDGDECAPGEFSVDLNGIRNPQASGFFGPFGIATALDEEIDEGQAPSILFAPNAFLDVSVDPDRLIAGESGSVTIGFTPFNPIPRTGAIHARFPSAFDASEATIGGCTLDGAFVLEQSSDEAGVLITIARDGTGIMVGPGSWSCTIDQMVNPTPAGTYGDYSVWTTDDVGHVVDRAASVPGHTFLPAQVTALASANTRSVGAIADYTFGLTPSTTLPPDGSITLAFPPGYDIRSVAATSLLACDSADEEPVIIETTAAGVTITRPGDGAACSAFIELTIVGVTNPPVSGTTGVFSVATFGPGGLDVGTAVGITIEPAPIAAVASAVDLTRGRLTEYTFDVVLTNPLPADGQITVGFPIGYDLQSVTSATLIDCVGETGTVGRTVDGTSITLTRTGDGDPCLPGAATVKLGNVRNPIRTGTSGTFSISTASTETIDQGVAAGVAILPLPISGTDVFLETDIAGDTGLVTIQFNALTALPGDGRVRLTFPTGFDASDAADPKCPSLSGGFVLTASTNEVTILRNGAGSPSSTGLHQCSFEGVRNPGVEGLTSTYVLATLDGAADVLDEDPLVAGDWIVAATMDFVSVAAENLRVSHRATYTFSFTTKNPWPADGLLGIFFPSGYAFDDDVTAGIVGCGPPFGTFEFTAADESAILGRAGDGPECLAQTFTVVIDGVINAPDAGLTDVFFIATATSGVDLIDIGFGAPVDLTPELTGLSTSATDLHGGAQSSYTFTFTPLMTIDPGELISFTFPEDYTFTADAVGVCASIAGDLVTHIDGTIVSLERPVDAPLEPIAAETCRIDGVINRLGSGSSGIFEILIGSFDPPQRGDAPSVVLLALTLQDVLAFGASQQVAASTTWTLSFRTANGVGTGGAVRIVFPPTFTLSSNGATSCQIIGMSGITTTLAPGELSCVVGSTIIPAGETVTIRTSHIGNPFIAGTTSVFRIETLDPAGRVQEQHQTLQVVIAPVPPAPASQAPATSSAASTSAAATTTASSAAGSGASGAASGSGGGNPPATTASSAASSSSQTTNTEGSGTATSTAVFAPATAPAGALRSLRATIPSTKAGTTTTYTSTDPILRELQLGWASSLPETSVTLTLWPTGGGPPGTRPVPSGVYVPFFLEVRVSGGIDAVSVATFKVSLPDYAVSDAQRAIFLHQVGTVWQPEGNLVLTEDSDHRFNGIIATSCCSVFAVGFDLYAPTVALSLPKVHNGPTAVDAVVSDNAGIKEVRFYKDGLLVHTASSKPYTYIWPAGTLSEDNTISVVAFDYAGNNATAGAVVEPVGSALAIDEEGNVFLSAAFLWGAGIATGVLLVALVVVRLVRQGRRSKGEEANDFGDPQP